MRNFFAIITACRLASVFTVAYLLLSGTTGASAQLVRFDDSVTLYTVHRINRDITGNKVLGAWGLASMAGGAACYFAGQGTETRDFGAMSFSWGLAHTVVAAIRLGRLGAESIENLDPEKEYRTYDQARRHYLVSTGLDLVYIGIGEGLLLYGKQQGADRNGYYGCGKAVAAQGVFLLVYDYLLFSAHTLDHSKWYRLMNEIRFTGKQVGLVLPLQTRSPH